MASCFLYKRREFIAPVGGDTATWFDGRTVQHSRASTSSAFVPNPDVGGDCENTDSGTMAHNGLGNSIGLGATIAA
jgi:hypothetical protein